MRYFAMVLFMFSLMACSLQEKNVSTPTLSNTLNSQSDVSVFVNGCYSYLSAFNCFKDSWTMLFYSADDIAGSTTNLFSTKSDDANTIQTSRFWGSMYACINNCNELIENLQTLNIDSAYKSRVTGEGYFLRAFCNFYLVRMWGDVPLKLTSTKSGLDVKYPRISADTVYQQIFKDLTEAKNRLLLNLPSSELGHATKGAALGFLAKVYLTYANRLDLSGNYTAAKPYYQLAENYADSVILLGRYSLMSNYADIWNVNNKSVAYANEILFGIGFTRDQQVSSSGSLGSEFASVFMPYDMPNVAGFTLPSSRVFVRGGDTITMTQTGAATQGNIQPWFAQQYSTGDYLKDYRFECSILTNWSFLSDNGAQINTYTFPLTQSPNTVGVMVRKNYPYLYKYVDPYGLDASDNGNDLYIMRISEIYLIKAEAENEINGPTSKAYDAFNTLRARARMANGITRKTPANLLTGLTKDQFRMKIVDERALEFIGEGQRWFDLVRMKSPTGTTMLEYQLNTVIPKFQSGTPVFNTSTKTWGGGLTFPTNLPTFQKKFLLFPIPFSELSTNLAITYQNPGY